MSDASADAPAACIAPATPPGPAAPPADRVTLDFTPLPTGQPVIQVWFDGRTSALFVFDTGSNVSAISDATAAKLGLATVPAVNSAGQPMRADGTQARMAVPGLMQIGTIQYPKYPLLVVDGKNLTRLAGTPIDGVLGAGALTQDPVFLDFQKHQATLFYDTPVTPDQIRSVGMGGAAWVPLSDHGGDLNFQAAVRLSNGKKEAAADLTVDTGGPQTIIPEKTARALGLDLSGGPLSYGGIASGVLVSNVSVPSVSFGPPGTDVRGLRVYSARGEVPSSFPLRIGLDVLTHFQVLIDFGGRKMYLKPTAPPAVPTPDIRIER